MFPLSLSHEQQVHDLFGSPAPCSGKDSAMFMNRIILLTLQLVKP